MNRQQRGNIPRPSREPPRSPTPILATTEQQQCTSLKKNQRTRKRCHGNRKLRSFKKKCIKRGLNKEEIHRLMDEYNRTKNTNPLPNRNSEEMEVVTTSKRKENKRKSNKRKRMSTSTSVRSITSSQVAKKMKQKTNRPSVVPKKSTYRLPKYLKKTSNLLFQALRLQLNKKLNTKAQQQFLHSRLQLIDQQYRLNLHRNVWQSYFTLGSEQQIWPVSS
jgi:hypothetical protein